MATILNKRVIEEMLRNDGVYKGDPQASSIYEYTNTRNNNKNYAVFWNELHNDIYSSPYVTNPILLWNNEGITEAGKKFLEDLKNEKTREG